MQRVAQTVNLVLTVWEVHEHFCMAKKPVDSYELLRLDQRTRQRPSLSTTVSAWFTSNLDTVCCPCPTICLAERRWGEN